VSSRPCWIGLALIAATPAQAHAQPATTSVVVVPGKDEPPQADAQAIAFRVDRDDRMTVSVRIGGKGPFRFLVDTGANRTVVSTALAAALGLTSGPDAKLQSVTETSTVKTATVPWLELSRDRVRSVEAALLETQNIGADGIVGVDSLRSEKVIFDFTTRVISIVPAKTRVRDEPGTIIVRGKLRQGHLIVTGATANDVPLTAVLDTGSELTMGNDALFRKLSARHRLRPPERVQMMSVTGKILIGDAYRLATMTVGNVELHDLVVLFTTAPIFDRLGLADKPAVLFGMNALRAFDKVSIDFVRRQLRVAMPEARRR
jgi:predicted aspartyl protease